MTIATPSALISSLHGSTQGTTLRTDPRGIILSARPSRRPMPSPEQTAVRLALARASLAWQSLSTADRAAWSNYASTITLTHPSGSRRSPSGFALYAGARALADPQGFPSPIAPTAQGSNPPLTPLTQSYLGDLYLSGYSRDLSPLESALWRVTIDTPPTVARPSRSALRSFTSNQSQGLAGVDGFAWDKTTAGSLISRAGTISTATTHTLELWLRPHQAPASSRFVYRNQLNLLHCNLNPTTLQFEIRSLAGTFAGGAWINDSAWHHFAWVMDAALAQCTFYFDGAQTGVPVAYTGQQLTGNSFLAAGDAIGTAGLLAAYDEIVFWDSARTPAQIAASYNSGLGHRYTSADAPRVLLHLDTIAGGIALDSSGNALNFTVTAGALTLTAFARLIMQAAETRYPGGQAWLLASPFELTRPHSLTTATPFPTP